MGLEATMQTGYLVGVLFLVIGAVLFFFAVRDYRTAQASAAWTPTEGSITATRIRVDDRGEQSESYHPEITYAYSVMGSPYQGSRIVIGASRAYSSRKKAEAFLEPYAIGSKVTVHYDPDKPDQAVLEAGVKRGAIGTFIISAGFGLIGLVAILITLLN